MYKKRISLKTQWENAKTIDSHFDYPHKKYPIIHVSGTDGKGSTSSMLASILMEAGYKVGTFNTPPVKTKLDQVKVNGVNIPETVFTKNIQEAKDVANQYNLDVNSNIVVTHAAFTHFKEQEVDIAVVEACMGAATDPTGVVTPIVSVLTNITMDHTWSFNQQRYADEKAGIIKLKVPCFVGETPEDEYAKNALMTKAKECEALLTFVDNEQSDLIIEQLGNGRYKTKFGEFTMSLGGDYQRKNLNLVLNVVLELKKQGYNITDTHVIRGLEKVSENTGLYGRWQILNTKPLVILDAGHTPDAWKKIMPQLLKIKYDKLHIVFQACRDKMLTEMTGLFKDDENIEYWFPNPIIPRLVSPQKLMVLTEWMEKSKRHSTENITVMLEELRKNVGENDVIFIGGTCKNIRTVTKLFEKCE